MKNILISLSSLYLIVFTHTAFAVDDSANPIFTNRFVLGGGVFQAKTDAIIGAETLNGQHSAELNFDDIGLDDSVTTPMAYALLRLGNRWRIEFDYTNVENSGSGEVDAIDLGSIVLPVKASAESEVNTRFITTRLGFSLVRNETAELGISAGVSAARIEAGLSGSAEGIGSGQGYVTAEVPLPSVGVYGTLAVTQNLSVGGRAGLFSVDIGDDEGDLQDLFASVDYFFSKNFGVGIGYKYINIDVKLKEDDYRQIYRISQSGPVAYVTVGFGS
jgi:hypothetical protein